MRAALWFLALFGVAVAVALLAGNNQGTVTVFWPPYRVDLSLNLVLLLLLALFVTGHLAWRAISALLTLPHQARRWRQLQKERAMVAALLDALSMLMAGRFLRARKAAETAIGQELALRDAQDRPAAWAQLSALAHLLAAESAHALQDKPGREKHVADALAGAGARGMSAGAETREGVQMRAARWALDDRDPRTALSLLADLPLGASRRTLALRIRLKAARQSGQTALALETARLLAKHRAFSAAAAQSILRGLATELLNGAHDLTQLRRSWNSLDEAERAQPDIAIHAAQRLVVLGGEGAEARQWLLPAWSAWVELSDTLGDAQKVRLVRALEAGLSSIDGPWLARLETAQQSNPRDAQLMYLAGMACWHRQLWGKAQQLLSQSVAGLQDRSLRRDAWRKLGELAQRRGDEAAAVQAWQRASLD